MIFQDFHVNIVVKIQTRVEWIWRKLVIPWCKNIEIFIAQERLQRSNHKINLHNSLHFSTTYYMYFFIMITINYNIKPPRFTHLCSLVYRTYNINVLCFQWCVYTLMGSCFITEKAAITIWLDFKSPCQDHIIGHRQAGMPGKQWDYRFCRHPPLATKHSQQAAKRHLPRIHIRYSIRNISLRRRWLMGGPLKRKKQWGDCPA